MFGRKKKVVEYSEEDLDKLEYYVLDTLRKGFNDDAIKKKLIKVGWSEEVILEKLAKCKKTILEDKYKEIIPETELIEFKEHSLEYDQKKKKRGDSMFGRMKPEEAGYYLRDIEADKRFFVNDGRALGNMNELMESLKDMDEETFNHHVNKEKNDFMNWVKDVVGDKVLAKWVARGNKKVLCARVEKRVKQLRKIAG